MHRFTRLIIIGCLIIGLVGISLAQDQHTDHDDAACDSEALLAHQQEHAERLTAALDELEHNSDKALEELYITGIAYQLLAVECGFLQMDEAEAQHAVEHGAVSADVLELAQSVGDPEQGQVLFNTLRPEVSFACATCHRVDTMERLVGPGLLGVGDPAHDPTAHAAGETHTETGHETAAHADMGTPVPERSIEEVIDYLRTSITNPSDFVVPDFPDDLMPKIYAEIFTEDEINNLIAYLLTLR